MRYPVRNLILFSLLFCAGGLCGQDLPFRYLGQAEGLRTISTWHCAIDAYGFFWIASPDGLVRFNGIETSYYYTTTHPELPGDQIGYLFCDSRNRIWVCTDKGLAFLDENRQLHRQVIDSSNLERRAVFCFEGSGGEIYALSEGHALMFDTVRQSWIRQPWIESFTSGRYLRDLRRLDKDKYVLISSNEGAIVFDTKLKKQQVFIPVGDAGTAARFDDDHILIGQFSSFGLFLANINDSCDIQGIAPPPVFPVDNIHGRIRSMVRAIDGYVYLTTGSSGLLRLDPTLSSYTHYMHDPVNPRTIVDDNMRQIATDSSGNIVLTTGDGVNYTNVLSESVTYINYVKTPEAQILDKHVLNIAEDRQGRLWLCLFDDIIILNQDLRTTSRPVFPASYKWKFSRQSPSCVEQDARGNMWVSIQHEGFFIFDVNGTFKTFLNPMNYHGYTQAMLDTRILREGNDGFMYVGTERGLFRIRHADHAMDTFPEDPGMAPLRKARIVDILFSERDLWVGTSPRGAAWHYSFAQKTMNKLDMQDGMSSDRVYGLARDLQGNIYAGAHEGLSIIHTDSSVTTLTKDNGLISPRIESIESDPEGNIWMTNNYNVLKYDPVRQKISRLGGMQGLKGVDFVIAGSSVLSSGEIIFGANKGFVMIDPSALRLETPPVTINVFYHASAGQEVPCHEGEPLIFPYNHENLRFSFVVRDIFVADQYVYRYRISEDEKTTWSVPSANATIDFNPGPGKYALDVEAFDGTQWHSMPFPVMVIIKYPWWQQWWFISLASLVVLFILGTYYQATINRYRKELRVTRQIAELESKALRAQMNPHFVFNCLNAIQECVVTGKLDEAYTYLSKFSRLLRLVLESSDQPVISLLQELEILQLYVSLEKLRFKDSFEARFVHDDELEDEQIRIPPMMIQPHIENAIWHGLRHLHGPKALRVSFRDAKDYLIVTIEDNGIGREKSNSIKAERIGSAQKHTSKGLMIGKQRIEILKVQYPETRMEIDDLHNEAGEATGTRVTLVLPVLPNP